MSADVTQLIHCEGAGQGSLDLAFLALVDFELLPLLGEDLKVLGDTGVKLTDSLVNVDDCLLVLVLHAELEGFFKVVFYSIVGGGLLKDRDDAGWI